MAHERLIADLIQDYRSAVQAFIDHGTHGWSDDHRTAVVYEIARGSEGLTQEETGPYILDLDARRALEAADTPPPATETTSA